MLCNLFSVCSKCCGCCKRSQVSKGGPDVQVRRPPYIVSCDFEDESIYNGSSLYSIPPIRVQPTTAVTDTSGVTRTDESLNFCNTGNRMPALKIEFTFEVNGLIEVGGVEKEIKGLINIINKDDENEASIKEEKPSIYAVNSTLKRQTYESLYLTPITVTQALKTESSKDTKIDESVKEKPTVFAVNPIIHQPDEPIYLEPIADTENVEPDIGITSQISEAQTSTDTQESIIAETPLGLVNNSIVERQPIEPVYLEPIADTEHAGPDDRLTSQICEAQINIHTQDETQSDLVDNPIVETESNEPIVDTAAVGADVGHTPEICEAQISNCTYPRPQERVKSDEGYESEKYGPCPLKDKPEDAEGNYYENIPNYRNGTVKGNISPCSIAEDNVYEEIAYINGNMSRNKNEENNDTEEISMHVIFKNVDRYPSKSGKRTLIPIKKVEETAFEDDENIYEDIQVQTSPGVNTNTCIRMKTPPSFNSNKREAKMVQGYQSEIENRATFLLTQPWCLGIN